MAHTMRKNSGTIEVMGEEKHRSSTKLKLMLACLL